MQYCFLFICIYKEHRPEYESPILFPLPFKCCLMGGCCEGRWFIAHRIGGKVCHLFYSHSRGTMNGLHHSCKAAAEVVRGVGPDLRGLFQHNDLRRAVEQPGKQFAQLHLQVCCQGGRGWTSQWDWNSKRPDSRGFEGSKLRNYDEPFWERSPKPEECPNLTHRDEQHLLTHWSHCTRC